MGIKTNTVIVGAGPCGIFAVFELGLLGISAHVVDSLGVVGGQCSALYPEKPIYDIPGLPSVTGQELVDRLAKQVMPFKPTYHLSQQVTMLETLSDGTFALNTESDTKLLTRTIIIAAGLGAFKARPLRLAGINDFESTNLHYMIENKNSFKNKNITILGGGDSALDWVLALAPIAKSITLVHRRNEFRAAPSTVDQVKRLTKDENSNVRYLVGRVAGYQHEGGKITSVNVKPFGNTDETGEIVNLDELLVFYGLTPDLGPIANWGLDLEKKNIAVNQETCATNIPGIYAIGDINSYPGKKKLILSGFHESVLAAYAIQKYLDPTAKQRVEYTTTSSTLQSRLGVANSS
ncbi:MAG: ferredoxin--NADP(+) reductase [Acidiferrobacteraceae bacterium]|nr:ferredoxin--NADP(+) reductase [Acidiferrobacteraceae bacterium]|tara:strand:- start:4559 stop:5605 length:1047 start_codon:yes stop_codon:yes gene_type:complete